MTPSATPTLADAIALLAGRCDGARTLDGAGFNKFDSELGRSLAERDEVSWSPKQRWAAWKLSRKYRGQLEGAGIDVERLPKPPDPYEERPPAPVSRGGTEATVSAPPLSRVCRMALRQGSGPSATVELVSPPPWESPRGPELLEAVRALPLRRFDGYSKVWTAPLALENLPKLAALLAEFEFDVEPAVQETIDRTLAEVAAKKRQAEELHAASRAEHSDLEIPGLGGTLRPFQKAGVEYALRTRRCFIADVMGLGKTCSALATVEAAGAFPALVICPAVVKPNWRIEARTWLPHRSVIVLKGSVDLFAINADVVIVNYDQLARYMEFLRSRTWAALVVDEAHLLKTPNAQRTQHVRRLATGLAPDEQGRFTVREAPGIEMRLLLTGSPVMNRPAELISQLVILDRLKDLGGFTTFRNKYVYGGQLRELNDSLRSCCFIRRKKEDVLTELPAKQSTVVTIPLSNRAEYDRAEADTLGWIARRASADEAFLASVEHLDEQERAAAIRAHGNDAAERAAKAEQLVRIGALKYLSAQGKLKGAVEWTKAFLESDEKLVLFADSIALQKALVAAFPGCARILGEDNPDSRQRAVERFQTDPACRLIVCSLGAAGVGITLTAASDVAILELGWTPAGMDQAVDRTHRIGQMDAVMAWYLLGENTIDQDIAALLDEKRKVVAASTDGEEAVAGSLFSELMGRLLAKARGDGV